MTSSDSRRTELASIPDLPNYHFPSHRLRAPTNTDNIPVILVACGRFSLVHNGHLDMFARAKDWIEEVENEVLGCYLSPAPVSGRDGKAALAPATDRLKMCHLATENESSNKSLLMVDDWEARQDAVTTLQVLNHFKEEAEKALARKFEEDIPTLVVILLAGADDIALMFPTNRNLEEETIEILKNFSVVAVERPGTDITANLWEMKDIHRHDIDVIPNKSEADVSSTEVRNSLKAGNDVGHLVPPEVIEYIKGHSLYQ